MRIVWARRGYRRPILGVGLVLVALGVGIGIGVRDGLPVSFSSSSAYAALGSNPHLIADVAGRALPSVVNIASTRRVRVSSPMNPFFRHFFGRHGGGSGYRMQRGQGSGVIISADGVVITNNHVVQDAQKVRVTLSNKRSYDAKVLGTDPKSDLAVIKLEGAHGLKPITLGDSSKLRLGDIVLAIGNPFGIGQTVTMGIVSAKGRSHMGIVDYEDFIQTDAAINPGNSGGALVNLRGELVGINTAILSRSGGYQGIGFAIPTNLAKPVIQALRTTGKVVRGYIGVMIQEINADMAKAMALPHSRGVLISDVIPGGPAARAGLRRGDFVVAIGARKTPTAVRLRNLVANASSGRKLRFSLWRDGKKLTIPVTTGRLSAAPVAARGGHGQAPSAFGGLQVAPLTSDARRRYGITRDLHQGVVIARVVPGSQAEHAGLRAGDVILEANRVKITTVRRFAQVYRQAKRQILLLVQRRDTTLFLLLPK